MIRIQPLKHLLLFSLFTLIHVQLFGQKVSIAFVGDVMQHGPQIKGAYNAKLDQYEYDPSFQFVKPYISSADLSIANLEVTHNGKPYSGYPQFSAPDDLSDALKRAGFGVIVTANNHSCDGGAKGVVRTLDVLDSLKIPHTGTFRSKAERDATYPLIVEKKGIKIAILNYTYGTNGLFVKEPLIVNYIDSASIKKDVEKAKKQADYIICTIHWGNEYQSKPNAYQKHWEKYIYEQGVDMIIGSHPHVIQPIERKVVDGKERLTAYSLGNFVSNQRDRYKNGGLMVFADIEKVDSNVKLKDVTYRFAYVHTKLVGTFKHYYILPSYDYSKDSGFIDGEDLKAMQLFLDDSRKLFAANNIGNVKEAPVDSNEFVDLLLEGYYSILIQEQTKYNKLLPRENMDYAHRYVDPEGKAYWLCGMNKSKQAAEQNRFLLEAMKVKGDLKVVYVTRKALKIVE